MTPRSLILGIAFTALLIEGCNHCCKRSQSPPCPNGPVGPAPFLGGPPNIPRQNLPLDPVPTPSRSAPEVLLPSNTPPGTSGYVPAPSKGPVTLGEPDFSSAAAVEEKKAPAKQTPPPPPAIEEESSSSPLPVGIAEFSEVKKGVNTGLRPNHLEGFNWLQSKEYKTVLFLRSDKEDDSSDRKQAENRGLKYLALTVTPETIKPELIAEFNRIVDDPAGRPIFVYDTNGTRAGAMWYLYFRTDENLSNDEAIVRARRYGLKEKGTDEQTRLMTAVQKYLAERKGP